MSDAPLPEFDEAQRRDAVHWLIGAILALALSGISPLLLVLARTTQSESALPLSEYFHKALVIHVDLSVLVWLLAMAGTFWSLGTVRRLPLVANFAFWSFASGLAAMSVSAFIPDSEALMVNYIPILNTPLFFIALSLILAGTLFKLFEMLNQKLHITRGSLASAQQVGIHITALITAFALIAFFWSYHELSSLPGIEQLNPETYYEMLFWAGGHILQFTYTLLMMIAWIMLASAMNLGPLMRPGKLVGIYTIAFLAVIISPLAYLLYEIDSSEFREFFTLHMKHAGGIAPILLGVFILIALLRNPGAGKGTPYQSALLASMLLFLAGGLIGYRIEGGTVTTPAHYHGSIIGVTIALMGAVYYLLPRLGFGEVTGKLAWAQPWLLGIGQLMHIIGLMWMGGYGVSRKTTAVDAEGSVEMALQLFRLGGLLAVLGGILFIWLCYRSLRKKGSK